MANTDSGRLLAGRYRLDRQIGRGSMGTVWASTDTKLQRSVAIKLMKDRAATVQESLARFEQEAVAVARLRSPYIVQVYDYGVDQQCPFIVMELLEGEDLGRLLKRSPEPLPMAETARIIVQTAKGLHAAHEGGVVHRDLKPANIFLVEEHGEAIAKVFDFGIAKALSGAGADSEMTAEGVLLGTPRYMSPEQAHGAKHVDHRSDLWSLGVIAYHCVTGRYPFKGSGLGEIIANICTEPLTPASSIFPYLPVEMDLFFELALSKDPDKRFQSARELGAAFARLTDASIPSLQLPISHPEAVAVHALGGTASAPSASSSSGRAAAPAIAGAAPSPDSTLGAAAHTLNDGRARRRRVTLIAAALLTAGIIAAGVLMPRTESNSETVDSAANAANAGDSTSVAASPPTPVTTDGALGETNRDGGAGEAASAQAETSSAARGSSAPRSPTGTRAPARATSSKTSASDKPAAAPQPKPKSTGNGLDQFDNRF